MNPSLALQHCRIVSPERLSDRFLSSGILWQKDSTELANQVAVAYIFEITKPWFPSSKVLPSLLEVLEAQHQKLKADKTIGDQFELLLRRINQELNSISEQGETDWIGNFNALVMVLSGEELHFSQTGRCPAYILQNNRIRQITDDTSGEREPHPLKTFSNLASGRLQEKDYILLANQELYQSISLDALRRVIHSATPYQASSAIVRELKKDRNPAVSSLIFKITPPPAIQGKIQEPTEIILEEELQSNFKKAQKKLMPVLVKAKETSVVAGKVGWKYTSKASTTVREMVTPAAKTLLEKGKEQARSLQKPAESEKSAPSVEVILPKSKRAAPAPKQPQVLKGTEGLLTPLTSFQDRFKTWFANPRHKKMSALAVAVILIGITMQIAISKRQPAGETASVAEIEQTLQKASELSQKAATALELKQDIEASREIKEGQTLLAGLTNLNDSQQKTADETWEALSKSADTLDKTTRLTPLEPTYSFTGTGQSLTAILPYFYSTNPTTPGLLQTGKGETNQVQTTIALPDSTDGTLALTTSTEPDTQGYLLTRQNKVYRLVQSNDETFLRAIAPSEGTFATGDAISSYAGNIYILDGKSGLLWRYTNTGTTYNKGVSVIDSTKYDIRRAISLAIDGSIYILKDDGSLQKFTRGVQEADFSLKNLPLLSEKMILPLQVVTSDKMQSIYILDGGTTTGTHSTAKVLEFDKRGNFLRQYGFPSSYTKVRAFDVNPADKKLWILNGAEVTEFNL